MDFVDWCTLVWDALLAARRESPEVRARGITAHDLAARLFPQDPPDSLGFFDSSHGDARTSALMQALSGLEGCGLVETTPTFGLWRVTERGRTLRDNLPAVWQPICAQEVADDCRALLGTINRLSPQPAADHVALGKVSSEQLLGALGTASLTPEIMAALTELRTAGLVAYSQQFAHFEAAATYRGLVWETRRDQTVASRRIDALLAEWETASVEFKRELAVDTADTKAEFIRDILGLANTLASGPRWLIVGFDDKTRAYLKPPDAALNQDHLQQVVDEYIVPHLEIRYAPVAYRLGKVGQLEVRPERTRLPYRVKRDLGDLAKKRAIAAGAVYVRHGAHTVPAEPADRDELDEAARWASAAQRDDATASGGRR